MTGQDPTYLREVQYRDGSQLAKRAHAHVAYRTAPISGFSLFASLVPWPAGGRVLDVAAGSGLLWGEVAEHDPPGLHLTLTDHSPGMVDEAVARATATGSYASVEGQVCDARALPHDDGSFDVVVSTYARYHMPDPEHVVDELARVVAPDGVVALMTNGPRHLLEFERLRTEVFGAAAVYEVNRTFTPAMAAAALTERFDDVRWRRYDDRLEITDADDAVRFMTSSAPATDATPDEVAELRRRVEVAMDAAGGVFHVEKDTGVIVARGRRR